MPKAKHLKVEKQVSQDPPARAAVAYTAQDLRRLISDLHGLAPSDKVRAGASSSREWALFFELRNGTGFGRQDRYVDAFAFNLYPSKGHWRVAYEIKVSRGDFLSELKKPEKRAFGFEISNEFWYVTAPGVAKPEEIPEGCGLMVVSGAKLKRVVQAPQRQARELTMSEMAAIARASCRYDVLTSRLWRYQDCELDEEALNALVQQRRDELFASELARCVERDVATMTRNMRELARQYAKALQDAGVKPPKWMQSDDFYGGWGERSAAEWVRDNVKPGPNMKELASALAQVDAFKQEAERLAHVVERSVEELTELAKKTGVELRKLA